jgi:molybdate transport system permease protein
MVLILLLGTPLAYLMGRHQFRYKKTLDTLIDLPTVLPPSVAGIALLMTLGRRGAIGGWLDGLGIEVAFTATAVVLAQVFIAAPFYVRAATLGFAGIDVEIEEAAQLDGANRWQTFQYVILPLSRFALLSGGMMSWARALGEFGATIIFAGNFPGRTQTMPTAIYLGFERDLESALTLSVILVVISFLSLLLIKVLVSHETERV